MPPETHETHGNSWPKLVGNFDNFSNHRIMQIQKKLNAHPREKLNFDTSKNCLKIVSSDIFC